MSANLNIDSVFFKTVWNIVALYFTVRNNNALKGLRGVIHFATLFSHHHRENTNILPGNICIQG